MAQGQRESDAFSMGPFAWWTGVVEDRVPDPEKLGRVRVRIFGYHTADTGKIPMDKLFWAIPMQGITSAAVSGIGQSPTGMIESTTVIGFFMDGHAAQTPVIMGSIAGRPDPSQQQKGGGFVDPNGKYPIYEPKEQDVNRLARNEKIDQTIVEKKKSSMDKGAVAFGGNWDEPPNPYAAVYPYNHVKETESHHIQEFDDTEGNTRIHTWHRSGCFDEIRDEGTHVEKIVKDNYTIVLGDDYVLIRGNAKVNIEGNSSVLINGNADIEIGGDLHQAVHGNMLLEVDGNFDTIVGGNHTLTVGGNQTSTTAGIEARTAAMILLN